VCSSNKAAADIDGEWYNRGFYAALEDTKGDRCTAVDLLLEG
jgi:hypothetical protein